MAVWTGSSILTSQIDVEKRLELFKKNEVEPLVATPVIPEIIDGYWYVDGGSTGVLASGEKGDAGDSFSISATFDSVVEMNASFDTSSLSEGSFVMIAGDVEDEDTASLYVKTSTGFTFVSDLSGAQGIKGDTGETGPAGSDGTNGTNGSDGSDGENGADGFSPYISDTGTWVTSTGDTGVSAAGADGATGAAGSNGTDGTDGFSPYISNDGTWVTSTGDTGVSATGPAGADGADGAAGADGEDGFSPYISETTGNWVGADGDTGVSATGPAGADGADGQDGANGADGQDGDTGVYSYETASLTDGVLTLAVGAKNVVNTSSATDTVSSLVITGGPADLSTAEVTLRVVFYGIVNSDITAYTLALPSDWIWSGDVPNTVTDSTFSFTAEFSADPRVHLDITSDYSTGIQQIIVEHVRTLYGSGSVVSDGEEVI